jgi:Protein of unknown function (DUF3499)
MRLSRPVPRTCRRPGCPGWPTASLSFRYADAQVHLLDLVDEPHPTRWDLCTFHADALQVPRGWERIDERGSPELSIRFGADVDRAEDDGTHATEGSQGIAADPGAGAPRRTQPPSSTTAERGSSATDDTPPPAPRPRGNRYEALSARLPQLAAGHHRPRGREPATAPAPRSRPDPADDRPHRPPDNRSSGTDMQPGDRGGDGPVVENVPGQLVMPVGDVASHEVGGMFADSAFTDDAVGHCDNVVPLVRRGLLDPVT